MGFNLDNYETVKDRITRFYADHPDGSITTELVNEPDTLCKYACFKASAFVAGILKATGYAMEQQGQGVNKDAWVENAETSAIGRALANMDYCGTLRPSREEMSKVGNDRPADTKDAAHELQNILLVGVAEGHITEAQAKATIDKANKLDGEGIGRLIAASISKLERLRYEAKQPKDHPDIGDQVY